MREYECNEETREYEESLVDILLEEIKKGKAVYIGKVVDWIRKMQKESLQTRIMELGDIITDALKLDDKIIQICMLDEKTSEEDADKNIRELIDKEIRDINFLRLLSVREYLNDNNFFMSSGVNSLSKLLGETQNVDLLDDLQMGYWVVE